MEQVKHEDPRQQDTCKEKNICELFVNGKCDGLMSCPKSESPR